MESSIQDCDYLSWKSDKEILTIIKDERILLSDTIIKINRFNFSQSRFIVITDKAIYNFQKKKCKRRIDLSVVLGITLSKLTDEIVIHAACGDEVEYDYYYVYAKKKKIIENIARPYKSLTGKNLVLIELADKSLKNVVTTKKEKKKDPTFTRMPKEGIVDVNAFLYPPQNSNAINNNGNTFSNESCKVSNGLDSASNSANSNIRSGRSSTLYSKKKDIKEVKLEDFQILKVLGRGSFGKVCLVEYKASKEIYAMKSLKKDVLIDQDQIENTLLEKRILQSLDHPFLVGLVFCFQTDDRIYFVMPFLRGGELFQHLKKMKFFTEEKSRFYAAQIALALDHLHRCGIIYRDLKPENILMDDEGYLKLADFGMAKTLKDNEKAMSFCGTPEYLAPEIITGEGHNKSCDWWSFGILIYEMLCGIPPFYNDNLERMYELIKLCDLRFPKRVKVSADAQDLISKLLNKDQSKRLGAKNGLAEIKEHPFFASMDFDEVLNRKLNSPFKPEINDKVDVSNFDEEFTGEDIEPSMIPERNLDFIKKNQDKFKDF